MVLQDLGRKLTHALSSLNAAPDVNEALLDSVLKELCSALLEADVNVKLVSTLRARVKTKVTPLLAAKGSTNIKSSVQRAIVDELTALVDPSDSAASGSTPSVWKPKKKAPNVVMFVGLQGSGKTTSCTKLAVHYQKRGFKSCLVCADTFRAGAFDQLKQNAAKARIPFYGSYTETDPVVISGQGVEKFKQERFEVIIVDTSGRHRQETELFDEMKQISAAVKPDLTIMVLDGAIGQAAESQSRAFKDAAGFGAIIVTKMDGHARGGGAISACDLSLQRPRFTLTMKLDRVAATKTPIMFIGVGEHLADLERFEPRPFIQKLLGMGDINQLMERVKDVGLDDPKGRADMMQKLAEGGTFTLRDLREMLQKTSKLGPLSKVAAMIPGMSQMAGQMGDEDHSEHLKKMICITDAMTTAELDSDGKIFENPAAEGYKEGTAREPNRLVLRVARGSGTSVDMVEQLLAQHKMYQTMAKRMGGVASLKDAMTGAGRGRGGMPMGRGNMPDAAQLQAMQRMLPPELQGPDGMRRMQQIAAQSRGPGGQPDYMKMQNAINSLRAR